MPIATNPDTGDVMFLDDAGKWSPAKTAVNPQTKEMMAFDGKDWQKVTTHGKGVFRYIDDAVRAIASGVTFGYADELSAAVRSKVEGGNYEDRLAQERARDAAIPTAIKLPGEVAGGVAGAIAAAPVTGPLAAASGVARLPAAARMVAGGAAAGGLYGSGSAEGGVESRLEGAATGAAIGAGTGGLLAAAGRVISHLSDPVKRAVMDLARAFQRDGVPAEEAVRRAAAIATERPGTATLADVGGENVKGLVERVSQTPGAGRSVTVPFLTERQKGSLSRISDDLSQLTGTKRTALEATTETIKQRGKDAQPLYQAAYEAGDKAIWSPELERLTSSPTVQKAMNGAVRIWRDNAVADGFGGMNPGALVENGILKSLGGKVPVFPNLQFWDYTKRLLADQVDAAIRAGQTQKARTLGNLERQLRGELDKQVPQYAAARQAWAGPTSYLNAIEKGKDILSNKVGADEIVAQLKELGSKADQDGFREGAVSAIISRMASDPAKLADLTKYLRSPEMKKKIAAIMPDIKSAQKWLQRLDFEEKSSELVGQSLKGSPTARRLAEMQDSGMVGDLVMDALSGGHPTSLIRRVLTGSVNKIRDSVRSKTDRELANILTNPKAIPQLSTVLGQRSALRPSPLLGVPVRGATAAENSLQ